jgi:hypothetical protein
VRRQQRVDLDVLPRISLRIVAQHALAASRSEPALGVEAEGLERVAREARSASPPSAAGTGPHWRDSRRGQATTAHASNAAA